MHPLKHLERRLRDNRKKRTNYYLANAFGLIVLLLVSIIVAPLLHEFLHMFFLDINHKPYSMEINFDWVNGITGKIMTYTDLSINDSIILLGIGVFSNLILAAIFFLSGWKIKSHGRMPESIFSTYLAVGFIYDPMTYCLASEGDLMNILMLIDMQHLAFLLPFVGLFFLVLVSLYIHNHTKHAFREYYLLLEDIEKLEGFLLAR
ncbi:MAG: hypothetical protein JW778_03675 [Candidatus Altiarchaeota archaeon]|nr:hypothetical protein [Candidatus Altiarchaeota archaeon]